MCRERAAERHEQIDARVRAPLAGEIPERVVADHRAQAVADQQHARAARPRRIRAPRARARGFACRCRRCHPDSGSRRRTARESRSSRAGRAAARHRRPCAQGGRAGATTTRSRAGPPWSPPASASDRCPRDRAKCRDPRRRRNVSTRRARTRPAAPRACSRPAAARARSAASSTRKSCARYTSAGGFGLSPGTKIMRERFKTSHFGRRRADAERRSRDRRRTGMCAAEPQGRYSGVSRERCSAAARPRPK